MHLQQTQPLLLLRVNISECINQDVELLLRSWLAFGPETTLPDLHA